MSETQPATKDNDKPTLYEIRIKGHLGNGWADWFGYMSITLEDDGNTLLTGPLVDQAALYGLLKKVRDLGMPLVSVVPFKADQANTPDVNPELSHLNWKGDVHIKENDTGNN